MSIKHWPEQERPREKLIHQGAGALSDSELLAIFLRTGTRGVSAVELASANFISIWWPAVFNVGESGRILQGFWIGRCQIYSAASRVRNVQAAFTRAINA